MSRVKAVARIVTGLGNAGQRTPHTVRDVISEKLARQPERR